MTWNDNMFLINDYRRFLSYRDDIASFKPILDLRLDNGVYTNRGATAAAANKDFVRVGGQIGIGIVSDNPYVPLSFLSTYTGLYGAAGEVNIGYFSNSITLPLDPNKYFGLTANYSNGNREDTGKREQLWTIGISGRF